MAAPAKPAAKAGAAKPRKKLPKELAVIYADNCTGCEACIEVCPVDCIYKVPGEDQPSLHEDVKARLCAQQAGRITTEGELVLTSQRFRDQERNREDCLEKLREIVLAATVVPKVRKKKKPTRASKERRLAAKKHRSAVKKQRRGAVD